MFIVVKRKALIIVSVVLVIIIAASIGVTAISAGAYTARKNKKLPVYSVETSEKSVALTFDAAWGADKTEGIVNILNENQARGTFFLVGFWIEKYSDKVTFLHENNIEIGNHSNNHLHMSGLSETQLGKEINTVNDRIKSIIGVSPRFFRAPFGEYNDLLVNFNESIGMQTIQWDVDSLDWKGLSASEIQSRVLNKVKNGSIVLFHNNSDYILEALPGILTELKTKGYTMVTLSELVYKDNFRIDNNGRQHKLQ